MADERLIFDLLTGQNKISGDLAGVSKQVAGVEKGIGGLTKSFGGVGKSVSGIVASMRTFASVAVVAAGAFVGSRIVKAAEEQEDAINRLNAALKVNGRFTEDASKELQAYASELQRTTKIGDEATLANLALLQSLAPLTNEGLKAANTAAADLSAALGIDLTSAVRLVGRAAIGDIELFKRYGVEIRKGKDDAETFANTLDVLRTKFGGAAANEINTFSGATQQAANAFGDVLEELGLIIIQTPEVIELIKGSTESLVSLAEFIRESAPKSRQIIGDLVIEFNNLKVSIQNAADAFQKSDFVRKVSLTFDFTGADTETIDPFTGKVIEAKKAVEEWNTTLKQNNELYAIIGSSSDATFNSIIDGTKNASSAAKTLKEALAEAGKTPAGGPLIDPTRAAQKALERLREELRKQLTTLESGLKNAGLTQSAIIAREAGERAALIVKAEKAGAITRLKAEELLSKVRADAILKASKIEDEEQEKRRKKLQESIQIAAQNPLNLAFKDVNIELPEQIQSAFAGAFGVLSNISKGAQGAAGFLSSFAGAAANALAPGSGAAAQEVFNLLAQGPDKVRETFNAFFEQLPTVIENVIASIPELIAALAENIGPLIDRLIERIPEAIQAFIDRLPEVAVKLIEGAIKSSVVLAQQMPFVAARMAIEMAAQMPTVAVKFVDELVKEAPRFITELIKSLPSSFGGAVGGIGGGIGGLLGGIGDVFGFADGGTIQGGPPLVDRIPAVLTPGETVVDRSLTNRLEQFLNQQGATQAAPTTIQLVIGEEQLANVILDLNRRGYRLA